MNDLLIQDPEPGIRLLQLNRPEALNALNESVRVALADAMRNADEDDSVRVVVISGDDKAFAAGADIKAMASSSPLEMHRRGYHRLWQAVADCRKPLIAAVRGFALGGGCELALHCDIIIAGETAKFGLPEVKVGIMPGAGGTQRLVRQVGKAKAMRLLMTGDMIDGAMAERWGLASDVVADAEVVETAMALARTLTRRPPLALEHIKETVLMGADLPLSAGLALERKSMHLLFDSADQKEGMAAFIEKRKPDFSGS